MFGLTFFLQIFSKHCFHLKDLLKSVLVYDTFDDSFGSEIDLTKYLKESFW